MPLFDDRLSIWEIAFRWAGENPESLRFRMPLAVKDNLRLITSAVLGGDLRCDSLCTNPLPVGYREEWVREDRAALEDFIDGGRYDGKLRRVLNNGVSRWDFAQWCDKAGIPFPEFWFPPGWKTDEPGYPKSLRKRTAPELNEPAGAKAVVTPGSGKRAMREEYWRAVEAAAKAIWSEDKTIPAAQVARRIHAMKHLGPPASVNVIRKRIAKHAPAEIRGKPGRPPKAISS